MPIKKRLLYSLVAIFAGSLAIFFRKKALLSYISPIELLIQFMAVSALALTLNLFLIQKKYIKNIKKISWLDWCFIFFAGFSLLIAYLASNYGLNSTSSINYSFIIKSNLVFTTLLSYFFLKEKIYKEKLILIIIFLFGIYFFTLGRGLIVPQVGDILILISAFFISSFVVIQKKLNINILPEIISWGVSSVGAVLAILLGLLVVPSPLTINIFIYLSGIAEAVVILFMNKTINITNATYYSMMCMLVPVINSVLGIILLSEKLNFIQVLGGIFIIFCGIKMQRLEF